MCVSCARMCVFVCMYAVMHHDAHIFMHACTGLPLTMNIHDPLEEDNNIGIKHLKIWLVFNIS